MRHVIGLFAAIALSSCNSPAPTASAEASTTVSPTSITATFECAAPAPFGGAQAIILRYNGAQFSSGDAHFTCLFGNINNPPNVHLYKSADPRATSGQCDIDMMSGWGNGYGGYWRFQLSPRGATWHSIDPAHDSEDGTFVAMVDGDCQFY